MATVGFETFSRRGRELARFVLADELGRILYAETSPGEPDAIGRVHRRVERAHAFFRERHSAAFTVSRRHVSWAIALPVLLVLVALSLWGSAVAGTGRILLAVELSQRRLVVTRRVFGERAADPAILSGMRTPRADRAAPAGGAGGPRPAPHELV